MISPPGRPFPSGAPPLQPIPKRSTAARWTEFALGFGAIAVLAFALLSHFLLGDLLTFDHKEARIDQKIASVADMAASLAGAQVSVRQYILSGRAMDLQVWQEQLSQVRDKLAQMTDAGVLLESDNVSASVTEQLELQRAAADARRAGHNEQAIALLTSESSARLRDSSASALDRILMRYTEQRQQIHAASPAQDAQTLLTAATLLVFGAFAVAFVFVRRYADERQQARDRLEFSEALSQSLTASMAEGFVTTTAAGVIVELNDAATGVFGHAREELIGRNIGEILVLNKPGEDYLGFLKTEMRAPGKLRLTGVRAKALTKGGDAVAVRLSVNDVLVHDQRLVSTLIHDFSQVLRAENALRASEVQLRQITDTLPVMIVELSADERIRFHNRAFEEFIGLPWERIHDARIEDVLGNERYGTFRPYLQQALAGQAVTYEAADPQADGETLNFQVQLRPGVDRRCVYAFGTDITAMKRIDRMKTEFVSTVSHELRTPLTSIRASLGLLTAGTAGQLPEVAANLVGIANNNCERLVRLVNDVLDIEKIESGKIALRMQHVEIGSLVSEAVTTNEGFAREHNVTFAFEAEQPLHARVDSDRLLQVTTNLLSNAAKFSPPGGVVTVRVGCTAEHKVRVEVIDQGPGVPEEFRTRIFQKFSQADSSDSRRQGGTGLGLSISRALVTRMDGQLDFRSTPGAGATFFFDLPQWQDGEPQDRVAAADPGAGG